MDELFRFMQLRAPQTADENQTVAITPLGGFQEILMHERGRQPEITQQARILMLRAAQDYVNSEAFVKKISTLDWQTKFYDLYDKVSNADPAISLLALDELIRNAFNLNASALVRNTNFAKDKERVFNSIIAIMLTPSGHCAPFAALGQIAQVIALIERVAAEDVTLNKPGSAQAALTRTLLLPEVLFPPPSCEDLCVGNIQLPPDNCGIPRSRGTIHPMHIGELLVAKQQLKKYELGDVSNIENVLKGESKKHTTKHTLTSDQTFVTETEKTTETTKDLQTTERFELKAEAENTIKEDTSVKAGLAVTAKYGEVLTVNANLDVGYDKATSNSTKTATDHARDVTSRAASKVTERVRQQQTTRTIETFEDTEEHTIDNPQPTQHISGIYQYVNKVYEVQLFNYGPHQIVDIMVPEPAAFLLAAQNNQMEKNKLEPPTPFTLTPDQLNEANYFEYVARYSVAGVEPPPAAEIGISKTFAEKSDDSSKSNLTANFEIPIPDGYKATWGFISAGDSDFDNNKASTEVWLGRHHTGLGFGISWLGEAYDLDDEEDSLPVLVNTYHTKSYVVSFEVKCARLDRALDAWKLKTHSAIMQAYIAQKTAYEDKLNKQQSFDRSPQVTLGGNTNQNARIMQTELKKTCIALLTGHQLDWFNAIDDPQPNPPNPPNPLYPQPNLNKAEAQGAYIRFFEEAFEWDQMTYLFYPYFWARQNKWQELALKDNTDPLFADFLKAGEARVVVPVRLGFEDEFRFYLMTGLIWGGGSLPDVSDPHYLPITEEIKEAQGARELGTEYGPSWDVRLPTTLIKLRKDDLLPAWKHDPAQPDMPWVWIPDPAGSPGQ